MQAILLAGGKGERLGDEARNIPKPMLVIGGKPVLEHNIEQLKAAGVQQIYIHIHHLAHVIRDYFGDGSRFGVSISYYEPPALSGTANVAKELEDGLEKAPFYLIYGDSYSNYRLDELYRAHVVFKQRHPQILATIGLWEREDVVGKAGIVGVTPEGLIDQIIEKPSQEQVFPGYLVNTGHYLLEPGILSWIPAAEPTDFAKNLFPTLVANRLLCGIKLTGRLWPYDTPELLARVRHQVESGTSAQDLSS